MISGPYQRTRPAEQGLVALSRKLQLFYASDHQVAIYEASSSPLAETRIEWVPLSALGQAKVAIASTLYLPPATRLALDLAQIEAFGLTLDRLQGPDPV